MFEECEHVSPGDAVYLATALKGFYPALNIGRPGRLYDTIVRIVAPTRPAVRNDKAALQGTPLHSYRKRVWVPRTRNPHAKGKCVLN